MLTPYLPFPPSDGGQIRSFNLIKHLSKRHQISLFSYIRDRDKNTAEDIQELKKYCAKVETVKRGKTWTIKNILRTGFSPYPFLVSIYHSQELKEKIRKELEANDYDLIHAETFYVMPYLPSTKIPTVLVEQTINYQVFEHYVKNLNFPLLKPLMWIDVQKLKYWETNYWRTASKVTAVSAADAGVMRSLVPGLEVRIIPNGVGEDFENIPAKLHYSQEIVYMGNYKWMQNWEAAEILATKVFPVIKIAFPKSKLIIAGQFLKDDLRKLKSDSIEIRDLEYGDAKSVVKIIREAGIMVAPIYGPGGTRLKILGAMAAMLPVVTTNIAAEGLSVRNGESIMVSNTPAQLAQAAIKVLSDKNLYAKIARNAKKIVSEKFTWDRITQQLEQVYAEVVTD